MSKKSTVRSPELESFRTKTAPELITAGNSALAANPNFNYGDGLTAALFAKAAYSHSTSTGSFLSSLGWEPLAPAASSREVKNAYAFAAKRIDASGTAQIAISFEGSNTTLDQLGDWVDNVSKYGWSGYYKALQPLFAEVIHQALVLKSQGKNVELVVTGHSLGGAAASLAYTDLFLPKSMSVWPDKGAPLELGSKTMPGIPWLGASARRTLRGMTVWKTLSPKCSANCSETCCASVILASNITRSRPSMLN